jgi:hypothetical protein
VHGDVSMLSEMLVEVGWCLLMFIDDVDDFDDVTQQKF